MVKYLAKVKRALQLDSSFIVVTDTADDRDYRSGAYVELRKPDGSIMTSKSTIVLTDPSPLEDRADVDYPLCISLPNMREEDVPVGTEIWLLTKEEVPQ